MLSSFFSHIGNAATPLFIRKENTNNNYYSDAEGLYFSH